MIPNFVIHFQVLKTQYTGAKKLKLLGKEIVLVEKHLSCKCDCKIKEEVVMAVYIFRFLIMHLIENF